MKNPRNILITGASSGIGEALALNYAETGALLFLCDRHGEQLDAVAEACRHRGATVFPRILDVTDLRACKRWVAGSDREHLLDLVIANAGVSAGAGGKEENAEQARHIFAVNVEGVLNTVLPVLPFMRARHRGQIAIVSSVASFLGMPWAPAYCATKAARIIRKGLERNKPRIIFPWPMAVAVWMATIMPPSLMDPLMRQLPKKV